MLACKIQASWDNLHTTGRLETRFASWNSQCTGWHTKIAQCRWGMGEAGHTVPVAFN